MILVDTSAWIDHLRDSNSELSKILIANLVLIHPFVIGELACGSLQHRQEFLRLLKNLPSLPTAGNETVLLFIEQYKLMGRGIGYIDAHLLAAVDMQSSVRLWTRDKRLRRLAELLELDAGID